MTTLARLLPEIIGTAGLSALCYTATIAAVALTAVLAPTPRRRADARKVLAILLRRRSAATTAGRR